MNLEVLKKRIAAQDTGMLVGISVAAVAILVGGVFVIVSKEGKLELILLTFGLVITMVSLLIIHLETAGQLRKVDERIARYKSTYYEDIKRVQCPLHFTKTFNYDTNVFECVNTHGIIDPNDPKQPLANVSVGSYDTMENGIRDKYPYPHFLA